MPNPFERIIAEINRTGYHRHRNEAHSDLLSKAILDDLVEVCPEIKADLRQGLVREWMNVPAPGGRGRKADLIVAEPLLTGPTTPTAQKGPFGKPTRGAPAPQPDLARVRIAVENKSVVTAHRNRDARYDDLAVMMRTLHSKSPEAILVATVLIGTSPRVLNVPDRIKTFHDPEHFEKKIRPRLSTGDSKLWEEFRHAISENRPNDPKQTIELMRTLPTRPPGRTHVEGYDAVLLVPVAIDNVNRAELADGSPFGIDIEKDYQSTVQSICKAYHARFHM